MLVYTTWTSRMVILIFSWVGLISCAQRPLKPIIPPETPMEFNNAIRALTNDLLRQVENEQVKNKDDSTKKNLVIKPFAKTDTGYTINPSKGKREGDKEIEPAGPNMIELILSEVKESKTCQDERCSDKVCQSEETIPFSSNNKVCPQNAYKKRFANFSITPLSRESLKTANYVMDGRICLEPLEGNRYYRINAFIFDLQTRQRIATSKVLIEDKELYELPTKAYLDAPVYLPSDQFECHTPPLEIGSEVLNVDAIVEDASNAYGKREYEKALQLYQQARDSRGGERQDVYMGLYTTLFELERKAEAEEMLGRIVAIGVAEKDLSFKFLFKVNSLEFGSAKPGEPEDPQTLKWIEQFPMWLRQIGKYFNEHNDCLEIIGYASKTGDQEYNRNLSLGRAIRIKTKLKAKFKNIKVSSTIGKGYDECLMNPPPPGKRDCRGLDDERDAYDRRVEFKIIECASL